MSSVRVVFCLALILAPASDERKHFFRSQVSIVQKDGSASKKHSWWLCKNFNQPMATASERAQLRCWFATEQTPIASAARATKVRRELQAQRKNQGL